MRPLRSRDTVEIIILDEETMNTSDLPDSVLDGRYRVIERLGAGAMGTVFRAEQINVGREVAIKILTRSAIKEEGLVERFRNEAAIISKLRHPNTLKLIDIGRLPDNRLYIVTELLNGRPFDEHLAKEGPLDIRMTLKFLRQAADALDEAHSKGVVHRDLKPANMYLENVGTSQVLKVLDFGIARLNNQSNVTQTGQVFGTPQYMSPEQARGERVDGRSDLYSLGVIGYKCVAGRPPFTADTPLVLLFKHASDPPPPLASLGVELPTQVEHLIMKLLEKDPDARYQTAREVVEAIDQIVLELSTGAALSMRAEQPTEQAASTMPPATLAPSAIETMPPPPRSTMPFIAGGLMLLTVGVIGAALLLRDATPVAVQQIEREKAAVEAAPPPPPVEAKIEAPPPVEEKAVAKKKKKKTRRRAKKRPVKKPVVKAPPPPPAAKPKPKSNTIDAPPGFVGVEID